MMQGKKRNAELNVIISFNVSGRQHASNAVINHILTYLYKASPNMEALYQQLCMFSNHLLKVK